MACLEAPMVVASHKDDALAFLSWHYNEHNSNFEIQTCDLPTKSFSLNHYTTFFPTTNIYLIIYIYNIKCIYFSWEDSCMTAKWHSCMNAKWRSCMSPPNLYKSNLGHCLTILVQRQSSASLYSKCPGNSSYCLLVLFLHFSCYYLVVRFHYRLRALAVTVWTGLLVYSSFFPGTFIKSNFIMESVSKQEYMRVLS